MIRLVGARWALTPPPGAGTPANRSLSCHGCRRPIPAGRVRCRACRDRAPALHITQPAT